MPTPSVSQWPLAPKAAATVVSAAAPARPHVVFFLADDLGWADVGYQLPEAARSAPGSPPTPHLNALAADGVVLRRLYAHKFCSPSRMAIQSGRAPIHVGVTNEGMVDFNLADAEGGFQGIPRHMTGLGAVMRRGGYATHFVGKWDAGTATFDHTPAGRGYGSSLFYFSHIIDAWSFETTLLYKAYDLYEQEVADDGTVLKSRPATGLLNRPGCSDESQDGCTHADALFESRVSRIVAAHGVSSAASSSTTSNTTTSSSSNTTTTTTTSSSSSAAAAEATRPLFLFWAPRLIHASAAPPWQSAEQRKRGQVYDVPAWALQASRNRSGIADGSCGSWCYLDACSPAEEVLRRKHAALSMLDGAVGRLQRQLQARGMWAHTLLVFMSDNGGNAAAAANNWPLRGGKSTDWEGGVRVPGFVGGGFVPPAARGRRVEGLMGAWDWYATLAALAGEDAHDALAEAHGLPSVDALDMGPMLFSTSAGGANGAGSGGGDGNNGEDGIGPRDSLVLGTTAGGADAAVATRVGAVIAWVDGGGGEASGEAATSAAPTATATAGTTARRWLAGLINGTAGNQRAHGGGGRVLYKLVLGEGDEGAGSHAERRQHRWQAPSAATSSSSSSAASSSSSAASLSSSEGEAPGAGAGAGAGAAVSGRRQRRVTALMGQSVPGEFTDGNSHLYGFGPRLVDGTWCPKVAVPEGQRQPPAERVRCGRTLETGCLFDLTNDPGERFNLLWPGSRAEPGGGGAAGGGGGGGGGGVGGVGGGAAAAATPGVESAVGRGFARLLAIADKAQAGAYSPDRSATYRRDARGAGKPWLYYRNVDLHRANHSWEDIGQGLRELAAAGAAAGGPPDGVAAHTPQGRGDFIEPFLP